MYSREYYQPVCITHYGHSPHRNKCHSDSEIKIDINIKKFCSKIRSNKNFCVLRIPRLLLHIGKFRKRAAEATDSATHRINIIFFENGL